MARRQVETTDLTPESQFEEPRADGGVLTEEGLVNVTLLEDSERHAALFVEEACQQYAKKAGTQTLIGAAIVARAIIYAGYTIARALRPAADHTS